MDPLLSGDVTSANLYIPAPAGPLLTTYPDSASSAERVIQEVVAAALNPLTSNAAQWSLRAMDKELGSAAVIGPFSVLSQSPDAGPKIAGAAGLLRNSAAGVVISLMATNLSGLSTND